ncbi:MAG TPA: flagellar biosynthetic protein FliR, partial [Spirochaetota bacterium]|nr:flagellar biosynthetic protein FliR [Spirochaetota bacterium]
FLAIKGPLIIIYELYYSYGLVTIESLTNGVIINSPYGIVGIFSSMFLVALRISLPIVASLLLVSISMGLLAKAAPQMNLLMIGFPISIGVSFAIIILLLPLFVEFVDNYMNETFNSLYLLMKEMKVGT